MFRFLHKTVLFLILFALILVSPVFVYASDVPEEGKPAYTLKDASSFMKYIIPLIEDATGKKFIEIPKIKFVDRKKMTKILAKEFFLILKGMNPDDSDTRLNELSMRQASAYAPAIMGKYGLLDQTLYLMPKNLFPLLEIVKIDSKYAQSILKLIVVHELVHALQDQYTDFQRYWKMTNMDEINAFQATMEGHAVFVHDLIGRQMGLDDSVVEMSRMVSAGSVTADDPAQENIRKIIASQYEQIYLGGKKFIEYQFQQGGNERIWEILAKPPVKTFMIAHPETYSPVKQVQVDYGILLDGLEEKLEDESWSVKNIELGQMALRSVYAKLPEKEREEIVSNIEHVQAFWAQNSFLPSIVSVSVIILKNGDLSGKYIALLEEMVQQNVEEMKSSKTIKLTDFSMTDFTGIKADISRKISFTVSSDGNEIGQKQLFFRIVRGNLVLEFFISNYEIEDSLIIEIAEMVFERYQKLVEHSLN